MVHMVAFLLLVVGGINWLLIGAFDFNLVAKIFGNWPTLVSIIYVLVGLSAVYELITHKSSCKMCSIDKCVPADCTKSYSVVSTTRLRTYKVFKK